MSHPHQGQLQFDAERVDILVSIGEPYLRAMFDGRKKFEYRRRFPDTATRALVYAPSPVAAVLAIVHFGRPLRLRSQEVAAVAESERLGGGEALKAYLHGRDYGLVVAVETLKEVGPLPLAQLRQRFPGFHPPQSYVLLARFPHLRALLSELDEGKSATWTR